MAEISEPERRVDPMQQAKQAYVAMLKKYDPELSQEMRNLARESFIEGWIACEKLNG